MVIQSIDAHLLLQLIKRLGGQPLQQGIGISLLLNAVYYVKTFVEIPYHLRNGLKIILNISVDCNYSIGHIPCRHHAGHDGILVADITGEIQAFESLGILCMEAIDNLPCRVATSVVHK